VKRELVTLLNLDGFILFIEGAKGEGKTNFGMFLTEVCKKYDFRHNFASNIPTFNCEYVRMIDNYPELKNWLINEKGKKLYILDEAGKHIKKMRFMSDQNVKFMDLLQLIRHYDAGFIGISPSSSFIDSQFLNTDILDAKIRKLNKTTAQIIDYHNHTKYILRHIPETTIKHDSKHIAEFKMEGTLEGLSEAKRFARDVHLYGMQEASRRHNPPLSPMEAWRIIDDSWEEDFGVKGFYRKAITNNK
jgi:hypothetical protein